MPRMEIRHVSCLAASFLLACGAGGVATPTRPTPEASSDAHATRETPEATTEASTAVPEAQAPEPETAEPEAPVAEAQSEAEAAPPDPIRPESVEDLHQALLAATVEVSALHRLIEPVWGLGTYDPADTGIVHHCDAHDIETHPGAAFAVNEGDRFQCDRDRRRCTSADPDGGGYAFYFRAGAAGAVWLDTIVHHSGRVPPRDNAATRRFADGGAGVCAFRRAIEDAEADAPALFSVFVGGHTGLVEETLDAHLCGDEASAAFEEHFVAAMSGAQSLTCTRSPTRCSFRRADEQITVYGNEEGPTGISVTRPGMFQNLARAQEREVQSFLRSLAAHTCDED